MSSSLQRELEFRANFWAKVAQNLIWMTYFILIIEVIYRNTETVAGWTLSDMYILTATCFMINSLTVMTVETNLQEIPEKVRKGTLDFDILKPVDTQFLISVRKFHFDEIGTFIVGVLLAFYGCWKSGYQVGFFDVTSYLVLFCCSVVIFYSFLLILMTTGIWLVRVDNLWVLGESVFTVARFPVDIIQRSVQRLLTYGIPLAFIATIPTRALMGKLDSIFVLVALLWAIGFSLLSRWFWQFALRYYTSASS